MRKTKLRAAPPAIQAARWGWKVLGRELKKNVRQASSTPTFTPLFLSLSSLPHGEWLGTQLRDGVDFAGHGGRVGGVWRQGLPGLEAEAASLPSPRIAVARGQPSRVRPVLHKTRDWCVTKPGAAPPLVRVRSPLLTGVNRRPPRFARITGRPERCRQHPAPAET